MTGIKTAAKRLTAAVLSALIGLTSLTGCAMLQRGGEEEPAGYTQEEVSRYVRERYGDEVRYVRSEELTGGTDPVTVHHYRTGEEVDFAVLTGLRERYVDGTPSGDKVRWFSDNYYDAVMAARQEEINALLLEAGLNGRVEQTGREGRGAGVVCQLRIYLDEASQIGDCAAALSQVNTLLNYQAADSAALPGAPAVKSAHIYLQPDSRLPEDDPQYAWNGGAYRVFYEIGTVAFTMDGEELNPGTVKEELQHDYVDRARILGRDIYDPGDDLWFKYPAPVVTVTDIGDIDVSGSGVFTFIYDRDSDSYWMCCLDPCQDFEDGPYEYEGKGTFARMVDDLGGLYFPGKWHATWSIDGMEWSADLHVQEGAGVTCGFRSLEVTCNNEVQLLSEVPASLIRGGSGGSSRYGSNGTVSGRAFSPEDLEKLLHVSIDIDRQNGTAVIYKPAVPGQEDQESEGE